MSNEHPLIQRAHWYSRQDVNLTPDGCKYDDNIGAWTVIASGDLWVETPGREGPQTKKQDIETGEDQKGE
ncbi:hypothetical protein Mal52_28010 [Symmachiella dynata]|uniref:Uncharacterized protein n=1 Tax=Symmachiella dynata TaxID=2527995 RepID=A0A517ZPC1_9PLAN|nr:hypothetical protein [Symmachiella dynata]QDU44322.1 hypothetical protein Mal52_28010 [Symmachiella dynata]